jgi:hypothetical protein
MARGFATGFRDRAGGAAYTEARSERICRRCGGGREVCAELAQMREQIKHLNSDPEAIEREAREKLHYAKPGEVIITLPDQPQTQQRTSTAK